MRLVVLAESSADEAAIRRLTETIRGPGMVQWVQPPTFRSRGWPAVRRDLPAVIQYAHYSVNAAGVIAVVDTNDSVLHEAAHNGNPNPGCRLCVLRATASATLARLKPIAGRAALRVALGAATPAIEAWYLCGKPPYPSEQKWTAGGARGYDKKALKRAAYGVDHAGLVLMTTVAEKETERLAASLGLLRKDFPQGYGAFETELRAL